MFAYTTWTRFDALKRAVLAIDPDAHVERFATPTEAGACFETDLAGHVVYGRLHDAIGCWVDVCEEDDADANDFDYDSRSSEGR